MDILSIIAAVVSTIASVVSIKAANKAVGIRKILESPNQITDNKFHNTGQSKGIEINNINK